VRLPDGVPPRKCGEREKDPDDRNSETALKNAERGSRRIDLWH
jgi:hypothetical protein